MKEKLHFYLTEDVIGILPTRAHNDDAGYDLYTPHNFTLEHDRSYTVDTGVHVHIPKGYVGFIMSKSGLNVHYDITCTGVIDSGYTGTIRVHLYNNGVKNYYFYTGDKIAQIVFLPFYCNTGDNTINEERGNDGFGSTGR